MKNKNLIIAISVVVIVAIVGGGILVIATKKNDTTNSSSTSSTSNSSSTTTTTANPATTQDTNSVAINNYEFVPKMIRVKKGTVVTWTNNDQVKHTITEDTGDIATKLFGKGEKVTLTFDKVGTYNYHCEPHPYMHGSVEVIE